VCLIHLLKNRVRLLSLRYNAIENMFFLNGWHIAIIPSRFQDISQLKSSFTEFQRAVLEMRINQQAIYGVVSNEGKVPVEFANASSDTVY
jgi:hypothetical protein